MYGLYSASASFNARTSHKSILESCSYYTYFKASVMDRVSQNQSTSKTARSERTFLNTNTPKNDRHPLVNVWSAENDQEGNLIYFPPASHLVDQMCLDTNGPYGQPRLTAEAPIGKEMLEVRQYTLDQAVTRKWASNLRFIALKSLRENAYLPFPMPGVESVYELWLTEPDEFPANTDYVAVSYCWQRKEEISKYTVKDARSSRLRPVKAPNEVLDRAIHFAAYHSMRFIWIDQVCIDQEDRNDKELGIQSMDLVFQQAKYTAGVLSVSINELRHAEALDTLRKARYSDDYGYLPPMGQGKEEELSAKAWDIVELLEIIAADRWLTRAWILQEAACAGAHLVLLLKCPNGRGWQGDGRKLDGIISIDSHHLRAYLVLTVLLNSPWETPLEESREFHARLIASRAKLQNLAPLLDNSLYKTTQERATESASSSRELIAVPQSQSRRPICNIAEALQFLSTRQNSRVPDRLAILANLCDYRLRIDTTKVQHPRFSLSVAVLTMALLNGDLTILSGVPEEMWSSQFRPKGGASNEYPCAFSWLPPAQTILSKIPCPYENPNSCRMTGHELTQHGLVLRGYLWNIDTEIDLREIQKKYSGPYENLSSRKTQDRMREERVGIYFDILKTLSQRKEYCLADAIWHNVRSKYVNASYERYPGLHEEDFPIPNSFRDIYNPVNNQLIFRKAPLFTGEADLRRLFDLSHIVGYVPQDIIRNTPGTVLVNEWIAYTVMQDGYLAAGRLQGPLGSTSELRALFDVDGPRTILTPHCQNMVGFPRDKILLGRMSWVVESREQRLKQWNILVSTGMARGMWNVDDILAEKFLLA